MELTAPCTIAVATFGDFSWMDMAMQRAIPSARMQGVPLVYVHGDSLHGARNAALEMVTTPYIVYLDADDELRPDYIRTLAAGSADLRVPAVQYVTPGGRPRAPYVPRVAGHTHDCEAACITSGAGNWIVVGAMVDTDLVRHAGGWRDWPVYEDFDLWMRCLLLGATVETMPDAVYVGHVRPDSRNRNPAMVDKDRVHHEIVAANLGNAVAV